MTSETIASKTCVLTGIIWTKTHVSVKKSIVEQF
jgi:hypothetical protein